MELANSLPKHLKSKLIPGINELILADIPF